MKIMKMMMLMTRHIHPYFDSETMGHSKLEIDNIILIQWVIVLRIYELEMSPNPTSDHPFSSFLTTTEPVLDCFVGFATPILSLLLLLAVVLLLVVVLVLLI